MGGFKHKIQMGWSKKKRQAKKRTMRKGSIIAIVAMAILILTLLGVGLLSIAYGTRLRAVMFQKETIAKMAAEAGYEVESGRFPFSALGKASILNEPHGFVKVITQVGTGEVLGVHMVGPRVTELIAAATTAMGFDADVERWSEVIHPHPTLSEAVGEAVMAAAGKPLHGE